MVTFQQGAMAGVQLSPQSPTSGPRIGLENTLSNNPSAYLRSHKDNPVSWQEWSSETLNLAKKYQRPIFLSIGYSACHWCHVMNHESFQSAEVANLLNTHFIPIKVDRESRPDIDDIYMNYVTATTGAGGWPLNVFLTPDLQPMFGGTYWPGPASQTALPSPVEGGEERPLTFVEILQKMRDIWQNERQKCLVSAADITHQLQAFAAEGVHAHSLTHIKGTDDDNDPPEPLDLDLLDDALDHFIARYDSTHGGFVSASGAGGPKFPMPANLLFLMRIGASITRPATHTRFGFPEPVPGILGEKSCATAAGMALHTLQAMSRSALRDHLGNGFHRYSVTPDWNMPHFEKMLYDNAQLLSVYCDAWALGRDPEVLGTIYDIVEYLTNDESPILRKQGGWYASEDADSNPTLNANGSGHDEKKEGSFFVWTLKEFQALLGDRDALIVARHFGVLEHGNIPRDLDVNDEFISQNVLHISATPSVLAKEFGLKEDEVVRVIKEGKRKLSDHRNAARARPDIDDKVILSWNALAITALARAAYTLSSIDEERAQKCRSVAQKAATFISTTLYNPATGRLTRIFSDRLSHQSGQRLSSGFEELAFVDDYAYMIQAARTLFDLTYDRFYLDWALKLQETLDRDFSAGRSGAYYQSAAETNISSASARIVSFLPGRAEERLTTPGEKGSEQVRSLKSASAELQHTKNILNLKLGTDNALPSPNGVTAANLLYLSSYTSALDSSASALNVSTDSASSGAVLLAQARNTINAFSPEIIQHPFLYVSLLSAIVLDTVGVKSLVITNDTSQMSDAEVEKRKLRGFGRTIVRTESVQGTKVLVCDPKEHVCRALKEGELEKDDKGEYDDGDE